jgi:sugar lactone lactonase YvrE
MTNGGTGPYNGSLLFVNSGRGLLAPSMTLINPLPPYNSTVLLDNFFGRQFNSLNDIKIHPSGNLFFTDVTSVDCDSIQFATDLIKIVSVKLWMALSIPTCASDAKSSVSLRS